MIKLVLKFGCWLCFVCWIFNEECICVCMVCGVVKLLEGNVFVFFEVFKFGF